MGIVENGFWSLRNLPMFGNRLTVTVTEGELHGMCAAL
ncbi:hypothetical protein X759_10700 [Mesorhizobium sp. LSHC420B00]|jgi:hypothetical protein|nr:hypothetical protein X759_10700 [Mesorhizobium sp. LSHC420B00]